jgi:hypothetical protein
VADDEQSRVLLPAIMGEPPWRKVGKPPDDRDITLYYDVAVCDNRRLAGTDKGLLSQTGAEASKWVAETSIPSDKPVSGVTFIPGSACASAYAASRGYGVWHGLFAGGKWTWKRVDQGFNEAFVVLVMDAKLYVAGNFGIVVAEPLPSPGVVSNWRMSNITTPTYSLDAGAASTPILLAAVWNRGVFQKASLVDTQWDPVFTGSPIPNPLVYDAAASSGQAVVAGTDKGLLRGYQNVWSNPAPVYSDTTFAVLAVQERFYVGLARRGVLISQNNGASWSTINAGLDGVDSPQFRVRGLHLGADGKLYAAASSGVWVWSGTP